MESIAVSIKEAADALGVHPDTVRSMVAKGRLPATRLGNGRNSKVLVLRRGLEDLFSANGYKPEAS